MQRAYQLVDSCKEDLINKGGTVTTQSLVTRLELAINAMSNPILGNEDQGFQSPKMQQILNETAAAIRSKSGSTAKEIVSSLVTICMNAFDCGTKLEEYYEQTQGKVRENVDKSLGLLKSICHFVLTFLARSIGKFFNLNDKSDSLLASNLHMYKNSLQVETQDLREFLASLETPFIEKTVLEDFDSLLELFKREFDAETAKTVRIIL